MGVTTDVSRAQLARGEAEAFLYREARLIDDLRLEEWLELFTDDGVYWIPIDDAKPVEWNTSLVYDPPLRREERVHHLLRVPFPSQAPRSRTVHLIANIEVDPGEPADYNDADATVRSNQVVYEVRLGDFRQVGLGEVRPIVSTVEHRLRRVGDELKIARKKILLIDREMTQANLTFII